MVDTYDLHVAAVRITNCVHPWDRGRTIYIHVVLKSVDRLKGSQVDRL